MMEKIIAYMTNENIGEIQEDEHLDEYGLPVCNNCNTKRYYKSDDGKYLVRCLCKCQYDKELQEEEAKRKAETINRLKKYAISNKRYENVNFEDTELINNESFINCFNRCKSYCKNANKIVNTSLGLYISGNVGCGKTHLIYCMANELTNNLYSCIVTNFTNILNNIKNCFYDNYAILNYLDKLYSVDFLFIDDLGAEKVIDSNGNENWVQEKIFEIIDERYNKNKPIIFTSNYTIKELINQGFHERIVSRIHEMSSVMFNINAESYRAKIKKNKILPF